MDEPGKGVGEPGKGSRERWSGTVTVSHYNVLQQYTGGGGGGAFLVVTKTFYERK